MHPITARDTPVFRVSSHLLNCRRLVFGVYRFSIIVTVSAVVTWNWRVIGFSMRFYYIPTLVLLFYDFLYFHWPFDCIAFILCPSYICLWFCNSTQDGCFEFLCAGSLLFFRRVLGRVKNERKEDKSYREKTASYLLVICIGGVLCLLLAIACLL